MLYGQVDGTPLGELVGSGGDGVATNDIFFGNVKVIPARNHGYMPLADAHGHSVRSQIVTGKHYV